MRVLSRPAVNTVDGCGGSGLPPDKQGDGGTELPAKVAHLSKGQPGGDGTGRGGDFVSVPPLSKSFHADFYFFFFFPFAINPFPSVASLASPCFSFSAAHIFTPVSFAVQLVRLLSAAEQLHRSRWRLSAFLKNTPRVPCLFFFFLGNNNY